jgi:hypothetical protein
MEKNILTLILPRTLVDTAERARPSLMFPSSAEHPNPNAPVTSAASTCMAFVSSTPTCVKVCPRLPAAAARASAACCADAAACASVHTAATSDRTRSDRRRRSSSRSGRSTSLHPMPPPFSSTPQVVFIYLFAVFRSFFVSRAARALAFLLTQAT